MEAYPDRKLGYYPMGAGQLFRFVHEMKDGNGGGGIRTSNIPKQKHYTLPPILAQILTESH